jgi:uncharacterized membrane protein YhfC
MLLYYFLYTINALLMLVPPILLGIFIARKRAIGWSVFIAGGVTFVLSQVGHIPFNLLVLPELNRFLDSLPDTAGLVGLAIFLGLSAGAFEETARYLTYRYWRKDVRTWGGGMMLGAGHGGTEAILVGVIFSLNFFILSFYDAGFLPNLLATVPAGDLPAAEAALQMQIDTLFTTPWYGTLLGGIERLFAITLHLSLSLMVLQVFNRGKRWWLLLAIVWHALANAGAVIIIRLTNAYLAELFLAFIALASLFIIRHFKQPEPVEPEPEPLPSLKSIELSEIEPTSDNLERSRYV